MEALKFMLDNCLSQHIAHGLHILDNDGVLIIHLKDKLDANCKDVEWMEYAASHGYVVITEDHRIRSNPAEKKVLYGRGVRVLIVPKSYTKRMYWDQVTWLVKHWPTIKAWFSKSSVSGPHFISDHGRIDK